MKLKYNSKFYRNIQFWADLLIVASLAVGHKMIFTSDPIVKYALIVALIVLAFDLPRQIFSGNQDKNHSKW